MVRMLVCAAFLAGCTANVVGTANTGATASGQPVTFTVSADASAFSDKKQLFVTIWDAEQLAILDATSGCSVSHDVASGKDTTSSRPA